MPSVASPEHHENDDEFQEYAQFRLQRSDHLSPKARFKYKLELTPAFSGTILARMNQAHSAWYHMSIRFWPEGDISPGEPLRAARNGRLSTRSRHIAVIFSTADTVR